MSSDERNESGDEPATKALSSDGNDDDARARDCGPEKSTSVCAEVESAAENAEPAADKAPRRDEPEVDAPESGALKRDAHPPSLPSSRGTPALHNSDRSAELVRELNSSRELIARYGIEPIRPNLREDRLEEQIRRLEEKQVELDRRRLNQARSEVERAELEHRARRLEEKVDRLVDTLEQVRISGNLEPWSVDLFGEFSRTLRGLLLADEIDEIVLEDDDRRLLRGWLTFVIRRRRAGLREVTERVEHARRYVLQAISRTRSERGAEAALRSRAMLIMAQNAQRDAQRELQKLAHVWRDLIPFAQDTEWFVLPWRETQNAAARVAQGELLPAAEELLKTLALRLEAQKHALLNTPAPD